MYINVAYCRGNVVPLLEEYLVYVTVSFFSSLLDPDEGMLPLLKRLFEVKGHGFPLVFGFCVVVSFQYTSFVLYGEWSNSTYCVRVKLFYLFPVV